MKPQPPKFKNLQECYSWLENALNNMNQENLLLLLLDEVIKSKEKTSILQRWRNGGFCNLSDFSRAGYWYVMIFFFFVLWGIK